MPCCKVRWQRIEVVTPDVAPDTSTNTCCIALRRSTSVPFQVGRLRTHTHTRALTNTTHTTGPALSADGSGPGGKDVLESWESSLYHARHLQRCAEDLGAAMYPPQVGATHAGMQIVQLMQLTRALHMCSLGTRPVHRTWRRHVVQRRRWPRQQSLCLMRRRTQRRWAQRQAT